MNLIDFIILGIILITFICIVYFCFWKNRKNPCKNCPYAKDCKETPCKINKKKTDD